MTSRDRNTRDSDRRQLAILSYHKIGDPPPDGWHTWFYVPEKIFVKQLKYLRDDGWEIVNLRTMLQSLEDSKFLPSKAVLLTFDDGYKSMLTTAAPWLKRFGHPAVVFVPTHYIGQMNTFDSGIEPDEPICDWDDLRALESAHVSVQSHGVTHRRFSELSSSKQWQDILLSKQTLENGLGKSVECLAFPCGDPGTDQFRTCAELERAGYAAAFLYGTGVARTPINNRFLIPRIPMAPIQNCRLSSRTDLLGSVRTSEDNLLREESMTMPAGSTRDRVETRLLSGFDDRSLGREKWARLLQRGDTDEVFLTQDWMRAWWETLGGGDLLLIAAEVDNEVVALAPFCSEAGMVFFVGSGFQAYYLDFLGDISQPEVLDALLQAARDHVPDFQGFQFYWVPEKSRTRQFLQDAAPRLGLSIHQMWSLPSPSLDLARPELALTKTRKKSLLRHERGFRRAGSLEVLHLRDRRTVLSQLPEFFDQHIGRWAAKSKQSGFLRKPRREFFERLTCVGADQGWLRFTRIGWDGRPVAFHFGFCFKGRYQWYRPSFEIELARMSPGEVLMRQTMLAAIDEEAHTFDMGPGEQAYKARFATDANSVQAWELYPLK